MCGIVGYSGKENMNEEELKILLYFAETRGNDSCGVATPNNILKKAEDPHDFITRPLPVHKTVIGHTRGATEGSVTDANAHPFENGSLVGTHNGIIRNFQKLQGQEGTNYQVDSEIIWHMINKYGIAEGIAKLTGWMALAWLDEDDRLNLYRSTAPLYIGYKNDSLYYGSQENYLEAVDCDDIESIDFWKHFVIDEGEIVEETDLTEYRPQQRAETKNTKTTTTGDNTIKHNNDVPDHAEFVTATTPPGVGLHYWFGLNTNVLYVQPTATTVKGWLPDLKYFHLNNRLHVQKLDRSFPDLMNIEEIYKKIPETCE